MLCVSGIGLKVKRNENTTSVFYLKLIITNNKLCISYTISIFSILLTKSCLEFTNYFVNKYTENQSRSAVNILVYM